MALRTITMTDAESPVVLGVNGILHMDLGLCQTALDDLSADSEPRGTGWGR